LKVRAGVVVEVGVWVGGEGGAENPHPHEDHGRPSVIVAVQMPDAELLM